MNTPLQEFRKYIITQRCGHCGLYMQPSAVVEMLHDIGGTHIHIQCTSCGFFYGPAILPPPVPITPDHGDRLQALALGCIIRPEAAVRSGFKLDMRRTIDWTPADFHKFKDAPIITADDVIDFSRSLRLLETGQSHE